LNVTTRGIKPGTWIGAGVSLALVLSGCGGGHSKPGADGTASTSAPAAPLHVVSVSPSHLTGADPIVVTFRSPLAANSTLPTLVPAVAGSWARSGSTATFTPATAYPPDTTVKVKLVKKAGAANKTIAVRGSGDGSIKFAEEILARLQYIPLTTTAVAPANAAAEASAIYQAPHAKFSWRYPDTPDSLKKLWVAGQPNTILRGAVIAFQNQHHLTVDGAIGPDTWAAMTKADLANRIDPWKYSYISADLYVPQSLSVWVDGHTDLTSPTNGGVTGAPTPLGTYPVYERLPVTTMSGTNPDGSHYKDPGIKWVNYFSGGSAVHGYIRSSYGTPQSVGCLELPVSTAETVFNLINYGTLVHVAGPYVPSTVASPSAPKTPKPKSSASSTPTAKATSSAKPTKSTKPTPTSTKPATSATTKASKS
jgi:peptidoglycan hydrolase-like protein with peptidoglycan-binding domain